jgi:DNA-binding LacI/PurR family transcriptional regulator
MNIKKIAQLSGVSVATVSRVLNKKPYVKETLRRKVLQTIKKLNYSPRVTAKKVNVGIVIEWLNSINLENYENILLNVLTKNLIRNSFSFDIIPINEVDFIFRQFYDVIVSIAFRPDSVDLIKEIKNIPVVTINSPIKNKNFYNIYSDHDEGIEMAVDYLVSKGHRKIAFYVETDKTWGAKERIKGFKKGLKKNNVEFDSDFIEVGENNEIFGSISKIIRKEPDSLIVSGENLIIQILYCLNILNKRVPDDISVISFENPSISRYLIPPQTTINQNLEKIGELAVENVKKIMKGERVEKNICIKNELIERDSVRNLVNK